MERDYKEEQKYLLAKKKVKKVKDFYKHVLSYIIINLFLSGMIIFGLINDGRTSFVEAFSNFGVYSIWLFWGIGVFFHWLGVFGQGKFFSKEWEQKKLQDYMDNGKF